MHYSVECADEGSRTQTGSNVVPLSSVSADLGNATVLAEICADWPVNPSEAISSDPVASDIPTLLLVGSFDPITPPDYAYASALSHSQVVEFPTEGHVTMTGNTCSIGLVRGFFNNPDVFPDARCASQGDFAFLVP